MMYSNLNNYNFVTASDHEDRDPKKFTRKEGFLTLPSPRLGVHDQNIPKNSVFNNSILYDPDTSKYYGIKRAVQSEVDGAWRLEFFCGFDLRELEWGQDNDSFYVEPPLQIDQDRLNITLERGSAAENAYVLYPNALGHDAAVPFAYDPVSTPSRILAMTTDESDGSRRLTPEASPLEPRLPLTLLSAAAPHAQFG